MSGRKGSFLILMIFVKKLGSIKADIALLMMTAELIMFVLTDWLVNNYDRNDDMNRAH